MCQIAHLPLHFKAVMFNDSDKEVLAPKVRCIPLQSVTHTVVALYAMTLSQIVNCVLTLNYLNTGLEQGKCKIAVQVITINKRMDLFRF